MRRNVDDSSQDSVTASGQLTTRVNPITIAPKGSIAYSSASNTLIASNGTSWSSVGSSLAGTLLVFRPTYTGTEYDNVFGTWETLYAKLLTINGPKCVFMDDSLLPFGDPIIIPPGTWDMTNVSWIVWLCGVHTPPELFTKVHISNGATINDICGFSGPMVVTYQGTGSVAAITMNTTPQSRHAALSLQYGAQISTSGTQPFLRLAAGFGEIITNFATSIYGTTMLDNPATVPPLEVTAGNQLIVVIGTGSALEDNAVSGDGFCFAIRLMPGARTSVPPVQTFISGVFAVTSAYTSPDTYERAAAPTVNDDNNDGYKTGDIWIDTSVNPRKYYICVDSSSGLSVWNGPY